MSLDHVTVAASARPSTRDVVRAVVLGTRLRDAGDGTTAPTLSGHFAVFDQWTEIDSFFEGRFLERIKPGAFKKTFSENRDGMRVLLQHGRDPQIGSKPIAAIRELREDGKGAYYEAELFAGLPQLVVDGLRAGQYGASFRFEVMREDFVTKPGVSAWNPEGLPERSVTEAKVAEFGPVTFPAYPQATAGVRSLMDEIALEDLRKLDPVRRREIARALDPDLVSELTQLDTFIARADELVGVLVSAQGITDPDAAAGEPKDNAARIEGVLRRLALIKTNAPATPGAAAQPHPGQARRGSEMNEEAWQKWTAS